MRKVKVGDFGISKTLTESQDFEAESRVGTSCYYPPEIIFGNRYSWEADIWGIGCLLLEMILLKRPTYTYKLLIKKFNQDDFKKLCSNFKSEFFKELLNGILVIDAKKRLHIN